MLVIEHRVQTGAADIALGVPVNGVADRHVISRDGFGNGARRAANAKKPARHFLAGANLGEGSVFIGVQVDLKGFLMRAKDFACHVSRLAGRVDAAA